MEDLFFIRSDALPSTTRVAGFRGTEGISRPYEIELFLLAGAEGQGLDLADVVGARARLEIEHDGGRPPFAFHGIFASFELLHELDARSLFRATLVPKLWLLTRTRHSRIFTDRSVPEILAEVLEGSGFGRDDYVLRLTARYAAEEHVCQYQESNFDFISRWMEREGMYYSFEQDEHGERLVISDDRAWQGRLEDRPVRFFPLAGRDATSGEALHTFTCRHEVLPGGVRMRDYDYGRPTLDVSGSAPVSKAGLGEVSVHGGRFFSPEEGQRIARIRAEELLARQVVYRGSGSALHLRAGYLFKLEDHPRAAFDREYLVIAAEHSCNQAISSPELYALTGLERSELYRVDVEAIPAGIQFRAESRTPWPRIYGSENGTICGPAESEYAQIDEAGRYKVKFKFDESGLENGKASTWVRMMQPHGGGVEGFHFPLRKGTEVIFTFLGGDPDRPVIAGVVPNAHTPSPVTQANHTKNVIQTGGRNRIEFEDKEGHERITFKTPHENTWFSMGAPNSPTCGFSWTTDCDLNATIGQTATFILGSLNNPSNLIDATYSGKIRGVTVSATILGATETFFLGAKLTQTIGETNTVTVGDSSTVDIGSKETLSIGPTSTLTLGASATADIGPSASFATGPKVDYTLTSYTQTLQKLEQNDTSMQENCTKVELVNVNIINIGGIVIFS
jgi:type VI secretion system secreted protein VgrG